MLQFKEEEKIILIKRRHWLVLLLHLLPLAFIFIAVLVALVTLPFISLGELSDWLLRTESLTEFSLKFEVAFLLSLLLLILWQILFVQLAHYYLDTWIVTNQRTVHTELIGLFNRFLTSIYHDRIQDVSADVKGILPTLVGYGNVQIQTAGAHREFVFKDIPEPYETKEIITQAQMEYLKRVRSDNTT